MPIIASITITMDDQGKINVNGPLDNKMACYGLLEIAKDVVRDTCTNAERRVHPASAIELAVIGKS